MLNPENPEPLRRKNREKIMKNFERFSFQVFFLEIDLLSGSEFLFIFYFKKKKTTHLLLFKADIF